MNEMFTEESLVDSWRRFAKTITDDIRRINFQNTNLPRIIAPNEFEVSVNNVMQDNELRKIQTDIIQFIGQDLKNTHIRMKIKVLEDNEMQRTISPEQRYKKMADENPNLEILRKNLSLEID